MAVAHPIRGDIIPILVILLLRWVILATLPCSIHHLLEQAEEKEVEQDSHPNIHMAVAHRHLRGVSILVGGPMVLVLVVPLRMQRIREHPPHRVIKVMEQEHPNFLQWEWHPWDILGRLPCMVILVNTISIHRVVALHILLGTHNNRDGLVSNASMKMMEKKVSSAAGVANDWHLNGLQVEEVVHHSIHCSYEWELLPLAEEKDIQA
jgi:hypothetical protein